MHPHEIGPYKVVREIGRGGMGEVFLARDTRLDRDVAIKALPAHLAGDADRLARFQREAKALAALNHPGVGAIYGLEEAGGHQYLVLEFVEGETLLDRLGSGAIPVDEALSIAKQMAEALEAAHEKGIVHRDLKPGNVMVTPEGVVKVLDFGLARTAEGPMSSTGLPPAPDSPTLPVNSPTIPGAIMGTAGYMSPEQARGKPVDKRSDIFSFGCVFYEMLTGSGPFPGETVTDSLGAILHRDPEWDLLPKSTPARVRELLRNCLVKDRRNRLHDIGDARLELDRAIAGHEWAHGASAAPAGSHPMRWGFAAVAGAILMGAGWLLATAINAPEAPAPAQSFHVSTTVPTEPLFNYIEGIAPDARFVVYKAWPELAAESTTPRGVLVVRRLDRDETRVLDGTEGAIGAALSADGRWLAFSAARDVAQTKVVLKKLALDQGRAIGAPETLCDLPASPAMNLCWSSDREIIIATAWQQTILAVPASGGTPRVVVREEQSKEIDNWGTVSPLVPGKSILASRWALVGQTIKERTEIVDLATGTRTPLLDGAGGAQLVGDGLLIARRNQNTITAQRFDPSSLALRGEPVTVWSGRMSGGNFFVSPNGTLAMTSNPVDFSERRLAWLDESGQVQPTGAPARAYGAISISPDGGRFGINLVSQDDSEIETDLWIYDVSRRTFGRLPTGGGSWESVWSRDGQRVAYSLVAASEFSIWEKRADGSGEATKLYASPSPQVFAFPMSWSPDGKTLAFLQVDLADADDDIMMLAQEEGGAAWKASPYVSSTASEHALGFSPDGKWVMFCSTESGTHELYVQPFTGAESGAADARSGRVQVSTTGHDGGSWWSPDGKEIRFVDGNGQVMSVQVQTEPAFSASVPKLLYSIKELKKSSFSWAPDGRLLVVLQGPNEQITKIDLVLNFMDEVRAKLGEGE